MSEQKIAYQLGFSDVIRILRLVDESPFQQLELELEGLTLRVVQDKKEPLPARHAAPGESESARATASVHAPEHAAQEQAPPADVAGTPVLAPLAGTFYRAPAPGAPPFVEVGSAVKAGDVVGILEIMKLMNHVTAPCAGVIRRICARNEEFVEFRQLLAVIEPERAA